MPTPTEKRVVETISIRNRVDSKFIDAMSIQYRFDHKVSHFADGGECAVRLTEDPEVWGVTRDTSTLSH